MKKIEEITDKTRKPEDIIADLKQKNVTLRPWSELEKEYDPRKHPVMTDPSYKDKAKKGIVEKVSRITVDLQRLATKRMAELTFGIPVKRIVVNETMDESTKVVVKAIERIFQRNRIDAMNIERATMLWAGCEFITIWYGVEEQNNLYGFESPIKLRCKNYSPMKGDALYPLFDEYGDLIAISIGYSLANNGTTKTEYFDTLTKDEHITWARESDGWVEKDREKLTIQKIPGIYVHRPTPIWEDTSTNVYEIEWALSRNGNYLRKNSKPIFAVFSDEDVNFGDEKDDDWRSVFKYPKGGSANYITWPQATESLKFQVENLYRSFFTQLQLPDMSYESMKTTPMSGEARKMVFMDAHLKVKEESGRWIEALDREVNVIKAFLKIMMNQKYHEAIDALQIDTIITPYAITEEKDTIANIMTATGGKPIVSQIEGIKQLGWSEDPQKTLTQIQEEDRASITEPTS